MACTGGGSGTGMAVLGGMYGIGGTGSRNATNGAVSSLTIFVCLIVYIHRYDCFWKLPYPMSPYAYLCISANVDI
ncbi:hypothetical protein BRADI_4g20437v3 [Brachypodium distachyon]|uniref:Uncharacterized protein n=1 Tax=Brachypodium distachyon TaxID=15368 RepID=A0A2K2CNY0_BRADI|nr:hypothetical protein BRADI_4g20437v3 [Brachypodium distachyon]